MEDATWVAIAIISGIFGVLIVTVIRYGVDPALKLWSALGTLTGVALGSIVTFYFTDQVKLEEDKKQATQLSEIEAKLSRVQTGLNELGEKELSSEQGGSPNEADIQSLIEPLNSALEASQRLRSVLDAEPASLH